MESYNESLYTETLEELLENNGYGTENENPSLTDCLNLMDKFPNFVFGEILDLSMKQMFLDKYDIREIGSETEQLFMHFWREKAQRLLVDYVPKIQMWLDHFNDLFKFTVTLEYQEDIEYDNSRKNSYFLNPVNTNIEDLKPQGADTTGDNGTKNRSYSKDVLQSVWGKTRAQLLSQIFELKSLYSECLEEFETLFMGVL